MSPTVLVADDSRTIRKIVEMALKASPYEVVGVGSAQEVMDAAQQNPSVILLDYYMPDGSGYEVCRQLKSGGATSGIPVVMLGGSYQDFDESQARSAGADGVVMKPFKTDDLLGAIEAAAQGGQAAAAEPAAATASAGAPPPSPTPAPPPEPATASAPAEQAQQPSPPPQQAQPEPQQHPAEPSQPRFGGSQSRGRDQSQPRMRMPDQSGSQPRMRMPDQSGSQPRIPDAGGSQPRISGGGSQPRISTPDVNATAREQQVSQGAGPGAAPSTSDSGVSSIGASRAEIESMVREEVKRAVKHELPGLLRNIMGEVFQNKVLPKLMEHGEQRVASLVENNLQNRIRGVVRDEIERLLAEE